MLKELRLLISYHIQAASNSLNLLCRKPMATMMTVIVIAITLTLPALFWVFTDNLQKLSGNWQRSGHISLYLKTSLSSAEEISVLEQVQNTEGVGKASLKPAAEGLAELQEQEGMHDIMRYLPENPLPAVIEVIPALAFNKPFQIEQLYIKLKSYPQVEQAKLDMEWIRRLHAILGFVAKAAHAVMTLLAFAVILVIGNTLRLAIHNRHEEIQVLKLIGATDPFIARPFLYSGIWYSLAGAILAVLFVNIFMLSFAVAIKQLASVYQMRYPMMGLTVKQAYLLVLASIILGWVGARLSVKRELASIEPYN
ncbi:MULTISPECIES: permease-like cell division protein FtsX [unclassified Legionella]|uniref:permease-like cell division protein FtsX n=1 Tax=unclassified Legionella TaxID=2622702 RepID=UPI001055D73F|nr:permease-like cell division protein FtsX [Legionella sp. W10-070]MDI9818687.1 permease-like cell division protein FtsX [Legionella sp. PL877]